MGKLIGVTKYYLVNIFVCTVDYHHIEIMSESRAHF